MTDLTVELPVASERWWASFQVTPPPPPMSKTWETTTIGYDNMLVLYLIPMKKKVSPTGAPKMIHNCFQWYLRLLYIVVSVDIPIGWKPLCPFIAIWLTVKTCNQIYIEKHSKLYIFVISGTDIFVPSFQFTLLLRCFPGYTKKFIDSVVRFGYYFSNYVEVNSLVVRPVGHLISAQQTAIKPKQRR